MGVEARHVVAFGGLFPKEIAKQEDWLVNKLSKKTIGRYEEIKITICRDRAKGSAPIDIRGRCDSSFILVQHD